MFLWFVAKSGNDTLDYKKRRNAMKKAFRIIGIVLALSLVVGLAISCDPSTVPDGKTAQTKKSMTSAEYKANSKALEGMAVVEAYAMTQPEGTSGAKGLAKEYKFSVDTELSTDEIIAGLNDLAASEKNAGKKAFYTALAASLPSGVNVSVKAESYVRYEIDKNGVSHISSLDIEIMLDGKTIEIEKDEDDKWIEIDGTFFDNSELERMLDAADDAADAIEEFFEKMGKGSVKIDLETLISGKETKVLVEIKDDDEEITGTALLRIDNNKLVTYFNFKYVERDDNDATEKELAIEVSMTFSPLTPITNIKDLDIEKLVNLLDESSVSVKVNGTNVWADAFIDELD